MRKQRLFAAVLAIAMCVSVCSVNVFAENADTAAEAAAIEETAGELDTAEEVTELIKNTIA